MSLPSMFCWSKFGVEAGEPAESIVKRKDIERSRDGGVFLWGIGTSIRPSLLSLLETVAEPTVIFTPMRSTPAARDVTPNEVVIWQSAQGLDGRHFEMPPNAVVTSSANSRAQHFALVCHREQPIIEPPNELWLNDENLRNLRTGTRVGSSQVTSVVRVLDPSPPAPRYRVAFEAKLTAPYLLVLGDPVPIR